MVRTADSILLPETASATAAAAVWKLPQQRLSTAGVGRSAAAVRTVIAMSKNLQAPETDSETETVELETEQWDAIEHILEDRAEEEQFGAVPTNESVAATELGKEIRDQRGVDS